RQRPGDLDVSRQRRRLERNAHARLDAAAHHLRRRGRGRSHRAEARRRVGARADVLRIGRDESGGIVRLAVGGLREVEIELGPPGALERPLVLVAPLDLVLALADRELDRRLVHYAVVDALEPVVEEAKLIALALLRVERMDV